MKFAVILSIASALVIVQSQMPQRVNDPRMEYQVGFRPFGSDVPCYALINETLSKNGDDVIIERILMNVDEPGSSFISNSNTNQLDSMATRICGQMQNTVGYLRNTCQQNTNNMDSTSQAKLRVLGALREYLCLNNAVNLKEMISSNGGQCVRRIRDTVESSCNLPNQNSGSFNSGSLNSGSSSANPGSTAGSNFNSGRTGSRGSLTSMIITAPNYSGDTCRVINDAANCITDKYNRAVEICSPQFTMHMSKIISTMVQNTCGGSVNPFPGSNNNFNNNNNNNWNNNNNNQNPPNFNGNSNNFPQNGNNFPQNSNDFSSQNNNFGSGSNNFPQTADSAFRTTTWAPRPVWMTSTRRPGNSATMQTVSAMLLSVAVLPCLLV